MPKVLNSLTSLGAKRFFWLILLFLVVTDLAVLLDVPFLRQFLGFLFLSIIPGLLILHILKLNRLRLTETIVLSAGLSLACLMFFGLLINWAYFGLGYATPLSTTSLVASFSLLVVILDIIGYQRNKDFSFNLSAFKLNTRTKAFLVIPCLFPLLGIWGVHLMNTTNSNLMLMGLLALIPAYVILIVVLRHRVPQPAYPIIIVMTSVPLALMMSLRSNHIIGMDVHQAYYLFQLVSNGQHWQIFERGLLDSSLSVSLLPTIYQSFLSIDAEYLYKILYPLIFSLSPLVIYVISKKYIGNLYAFIASFFFMAQTTFLWPAGRTHIAIFFFASAIMVLFHDGISEFNKRLLFIILAASSIVSHYSTTYIFFFVLLFTWLGMQILPKLVFGKRKPVTLSGNPVAGGNPSNLSKNGTPLSRNNARGIPRLHLKQGITIMMVALFFVMLFFWYSQVTTVPFSSGVIFIRNTFTNLSRFFLIEARGGEAASILGIDLLSRETPWEIDFVFSWLTIAFIAVGVITTMWRYKRMVAIPKSGNETRPDFLQRKVDIEYLALALACSAVLVFSIALPWVLKGYSTTRTYFQMMVILSPFFIIGGVTLAKWLRARYYWVILIVLIPYFVCTTGLMYQAFDFPKRVVLNSEGLEYNYLYIHDQESLAARWLKDKAEGDRKIYSDFTGADRLLSQAGILYNVGNYSLFEQDEKIAEGYIYLRYYNVVSGKLLKGYHKSYDMVEYQNIFLGKNKIYSNGGAEVWR